MKTYRFFIMSLLALICTTMQAQKEKDIIVFAEGTGSWVSIPSITIDKKSKKSVVYWNRTEKDDWWEPSGLVVDNVPIAQMDELLSDMTEPDEDDSYTRMPWRLTQEGGETVLHCYFQMPADIVENFWLTDEEGCILDKETGISYRARRTEPDCYYKRFTIKGKKGAVLDFKIFFPQLPETTKEVAIYGVPNWQMRGVNVRLQRLSIRGYATYGYDDVPQFHHPTQIAEAKNYDKDNFFTWSEYTDVHLIKPIPNGTMAIWLTPEATYVARSTEMNWRREFFGRDGDSFLIDNSGHQYKCKDVLDFPDDTYFWVQGYSADYFAIVMVFEPLPLGLESITFIQPEHEPFNANFANWSGEVKPNLSIKELRANQKLFKYRERVMVE